MIVEQSGGTVKQCLSNIVEEQWNSVVEQCWWNSVVEPWNSVGRTMEQRWRNNVAE